MEPAAGTEPEVESASPADDEEVTAGNGCGWRVLLVLVVIVGLVVGGWWGVHVALRRGWMQQIDRSYSEVSLLPAPLIRPANPDMEIQIYYAVRGRALDFRVLRLRRPPGGSAERVDLIREALNNPSDPDRLRSPLPPGTTIRGAYILDGIVWLDMSREFVTPEQPTPLGERLIVYALVNTFLLNNPELQGVRFLVEGEPIETAWGWLDLGSPLGVNLALIG